MDKIIQRTLKAIEEVRLSGVTNMFDRRRVIEEIMNKHSIDIADFMIEHQDEYLLLLELSGKL